MCRRVLSALIFMGCNLALHCTTICRAQFCRLGLTPSPSPSPLRLKTDESVFMMQVINPKKDLPVGLLGSLGVVTTLYVLMAATLILLIPYTQIDPKAAFAAAFQVCHPLGLPSSLCVTIA